MRIVHNIGKILDPLGLFTPCLNNMNTILRKSWLKNCAWDEPLPREIEEDWNKLIKYISNISILKNDRFLDK